MQRPHLAVLALASALILSGAVVAEIVSIFVCNSGVIWEGPNDHDHIGAALSVGDFDGNGEPEVLAGTFNRFDPDKDVDGFDKYGTAYMIQGEGVGWSGGKPYWPSLTEEWGRVYYVESD